MTKFYLRSKLNNTVVCVEGTVTKVAGRDGYLPVGAVVSGQDMTLHTEWMTVPAPGAPLVDDGS